MKPLRLILGKDVEGISEMRTGLSFWHLVLEVAAIHMQFSVRGIH